MSGANRPGGGYITHEAILRWLDQELKRDRNNTIAIDLDAAGNVVLWMPDDCERPTAIGGDLESALLEAFAKARAGVPSERGANGAQ